MDYLAARAELTKRDSSGRIIQLTLDQIYELADQVTGKVTNASSADTYLLFSGYMPDQTSAQLVADAIATYTTHSGIHDIASSEIGRLLDDEIFGSQLMGALSLEHPNSTPSELEDLVRYEMFGTNSLGERISSSSIWDIASEKFVSEAAGNFRLIVPSRLDDLSVFVQSELPALLENTKILTIDGVARSDLKAMADSQGLEVVKNVLFHNSVTMLGASGLFISENRTSASVIEEFISMNSDALREGGLNSSQIETLRNALSQLDADQATHFRQAVSEVKNLLSSGGSRLLRTLGPLSVLATFMIASIDASAAEENGDPELAREIRETWVIETTGGEVGALIGGVLGVGLAGLLGLSGWGAAAMVAIGMVGGGYFGAEGAVQFYDMMNQLSDDQKSQVIQRLEALFFGSEALTMEYLNAVMDEGNLTFRSIGLVTESHDEILANARDDIAWRYALLNLNPFVVSGADYTRHNQNGELDWFSISGELLQYSEEWIKKRAGFLGLLSNYWRSGGEDGVLSVDEWDYIPFGSSLGDVHFSDLASNTEFTLNGVDFWLEPTRERIFGSVNNDVIITDDGDDYLFGADGDDTLEGGLGDDYLEGGFGDDSYYFNYGDGRDRLVDVEGINNVYLQHSEGQTGYSTLNELSLFRISVDSNTYVELDSETGLPINNTRYIYNGNALMISIDGGSGGTITIQNFNPESNTFGLSFNNYVEPTLRQQSPLSGNPETIGAGILQNPGGVPYLRSRLISGQSSVIYDASIYAGNLSGSEHYDFEDATEINGFHFFGSQYHDELTGTTHTAGVPITQADWLFGLEGDDILRGEAEGETTGDRDILSGGHGSDRLYGGAGNDDLFGMHDDLLTDISRAANYYSELILDQSSLENAGDIDYLDGGEGNDTLVAGSGNDILIGGDGINSMFGFVGNDVITSGDDRDWISGDGYGRVHYIDSDSVVVLSHKEYDFSLFSDYNDTIDAGNGNNYVQGDAGDDVISAGNCDDDLFGDQLNLAEEYIHISGSLEISYYSELAPAFHGNDTITAGDGADDIYGNGGNDTLFGGAGDDVIHGDDFILDEQYHGDDFIDGGDGDDGLIGGGGKDIIQGGAGNDEIYGDYSLLPFSGVVYEQIIVGDNDNLCIKASNDSARIDMAA